MIQNTVPIPRRGPEGNGFSISGNDQVLSESLGSRKCFHPSFVPGITAALLKEASLFLSNPIDTKRFFSNGSSALSVLTDLFSRQPRLSDAARPPAWAALLRTVGARRPASARNVAQGRLRANALILCLPQGFLSGPIHSATPSL
jgi:hypothetical protein